MSISINKKRANRLVDEAVVLARSDAHLPVEWTSYTRAVFELEEKTWTPALITILLAKSVNEAVDVLSLKAKPQPPNPNAYSARGLCHGVVVQAALKYGFSIRNTGSEPLNNSPFISAARIDDIQFRAKNPLNFTYFYEVAKKASELSSEGAFLALAAFVREALAASSKVKSITVKADGLTVRGARVAVTDFLRIDAEDRPRRLQAYAAACLDLVFDEVESRRLNDPSRDFPGDVHIILEEAVGMAVEVRGKYVSDSDAATFVTKCVLAGIERSAIFVDAPNQGKLDLREMALSTGADASTIAIFDGCISLLESVLTWTGYGIVSALKIFSERLLVRLREIEVGTQTLHEWSRAVAVAQGK